MLKTQTETVTPADNSQKTMPLLRNNYILMIISGVLIVAGFILMTGSSSGTDAYNPDIFSARRIVVGPLISFVGYVAMAVSIVIKPKNK